MNAFSFISSNFFFQKLDHGNKERKKHELALEKLQRDNNQLNEDRMKRLDFINKRLHQKNEARAYISNFDKAMLEYYRVFAEEVKFLPSDPQLSHSDHPSTVQKKGEVLFVTVCTSLSTYALYKYLK